MSLEERRSRLEAAAEAMEGVDAVAHLASGAELAELMTLADRVTARRAAPRVQVTVEAVTRGEVAESGTNVHAWVRAHAPSLRQGGASHVARVATEVDRTASLLVPD